jgi:anaerobic magnesium-protoporphyrin IX monomethyl ester cyclase
MRVMLLRAKASKMQNTRLPMALSREVGPVMPLGIAYIAASLRANAIEVALLDAEAEGLDLTAVRQRIIEYSPDIVGITSMTPTVHDDLALALVAKECGCLVVVGGPQANAMPKETIAFPQVDFCILGEGEFPMVRLVQALQKKENLEEVPGLVFKGHDNRVITNHPYVVENIDSLPIPARDLLPYDLYHSIISRGRLSTLVIGRGCPFRCSFCFKQPSDSKVRFRDPSKVVDEVEQVVGRYGVREINFVTDTMTANRDFVESFCHEILKRKIKISWIAPTRADCVSEDLLRLMKKAGCRHLRFGVESGSPRIRKLMNKNIDNNQMIRAFHIAHRVGMETFAYLILGYLSETEEEMQQTLQFVSQLNPDLVMFNIATPLPETPLFDQAVEAGLVQPDYWRKFVLGETTERIPYLVRDTDKWIVKAYRGFYFSPRFIFKRIISLRPYDFISIVRGVRGLLSITRE